MPEDIYTPLEEHDSLREQQDSPHPEDNIPLAEAGILFEGDALLVDPDGAPIEDEGTPFEADDMLIGGNETPLEQNESSNEEHDTPDTTFRSKEELDELYREVYAQLREIASRYMSRQELAPTLSPTVLVNGAYLRMVQNKRLKFGDKAYFFRAAAQAMRHVLVDYYRARNAKRRNNGNRPGPLDGIILETTGNETTVDPACILDVHDALEKLEAIYPEGALIVELSYFGGRTQAEIAETLGISERTVRRRWITARAQMRRILGEEGSDCI